MNYCAKGICFLMGDYGQDCPISYPSEESNLPPDEPTVLPPNHTTLKTELQALNNTNQHSLVNAIRCNSPPTDPQNKQYINCCGSVTSVQTNDDHPERLTVKV